MPRRQLLGGGWEAGQPRQCTIMSSNRPDLRSLLAAASQGDLRREPGRRDAPRQADVDGADTRGVADFS